MKGAFITSGPGTEFELILLRALIICSMLTGSLSITISGLSQDKSVTDCWV